MHFFQTTEVNSWVVRVYSSWQKYGCSATAVTHTSTNDSIAMMPYQNNGRVCPLLSYSVWQCTRVSEKPNITAGWPHEISHYTPTYRHTWTQTHTPKCTQMRINGHKCTLNIKHILDQQYGCNYSREHVHRCTHTRSTVQIVSLCLSGPAHWLSSLFYHHYHYCKYSSICIYTGISKPWKQNEVERKKKGGKMKECISHQSDSENPQSLLSYC